MNQLLVYFDLVPRDLFMIPAGALFFVIFWRFMQTQVFAPFIKLSETREALTSGAHDSARETIERAAQAEADFESRIAQARIAAMHEKLAQIEKSKKEAAEIIERAESEAQEIIRSVRWENAQQLAGWKAEAASKADELVQATLQQLDR